jgi:hypothetical protein
VKFECHEANCCSMLGEMIDVPVSP